MDRHGRDARLALLARRQGGAFTWSQALALGFPASTMARRVRSGAWRRLHPGVYAAGGTASAPELDLWAALLAAGPAAVLSHETAAALHGAERLSDHPITLTAPHGSHHRIGGAFVHQIDDLKPWQTTTWRGMPLTTAARAVVELGATCSVEVVGRVADDLVRARRTTFDAIGAVLADVARPGKPGVLVVGEMLDRRGDGYVPPGSELERALFDTLTAGGLPAPARQVPLPGRGPIKGLVDGAYLDAQMVLEADGRRWHARMEAARRDRERDAHVVRAGWVPLRFVYEQVMSQPDEVCDIVRETRERRLALLARAA